MTLFTLPRIRVVTAPDIDDLYAERRLTEQVFAADPNSENAAALDAAIQACEIAECDQLTRAHARF